jgi:predicted kinase
MGENLLILTVGLPRSGKSTWARAQVDLGAVVVNLDSIRIALHGRTFSPEAEDHVWAIAKTMVRALFGAGHSRIIVDATNTTRKRRDFWQPREGLDLWRVCFHVVNTDESTCLSRSNDELNPVIKMMALQFEKIEEREGTLYP